MAQNQSVTPIAEQNISGYGLPALQWGRMLERLQGEWKMPAQPEFGGTPEPNTHWLATARADGRPHVVPIGVVWHEDAFYFSSGDSIRKSKDLARDPRCSLTIAAAGVDIGLEGEASKVTDDAELNRSAEVFASDGWAPTVLDGGFHHEFSAPSAGPPLWYVWRFTPRTVYGFTTAEPYGATRWRF